VVAFVLDLQALDPPEYGEDGLNASWFSKCCNGSQLSNTLCCN
jgi:hypothetical protein